MGGHVVEVFCGRKPTSGGSSETETNEPIVNPTGPSDPAAVITVTPVAKWPSTVRKWALSKPDMTGRLDNRRRPGGSAQSSTNCMPSAAANTSMPMRSPTRRAQVACTSRSSSLRSGSWWNRAKRRAPARRATVSA